MQFSQTLSTLVARDNGEFEITVGDDWLQGRAMFGGLLAAAGNAALRNLVPAGPTAPLAANNIHRTGARRSVADANEGASRRQSSDACAVRNP